MHPAKRETPVPLALKQDALPLSAAQAPAPFPSAQAIAVQAALASHSAYLPSPDAPSPGASSSVSANGTTTTAPRRPAAVAFAHATPADGARWVGTTTSREVRLPGPRGGISRPNPVSGGEFVCPHADCRRLFRRKTSLTNHVKAHSNANSRSILRTKRLRRQAEQARFNAARVQAAHLPAAGMEAAAHARANAEVAARAAAARVPGAALQVRAGVAGYPAYPPHYGAPVPPTLSLGAAFDAPVARAQSLPWSALTAEGDVGSSGYADEDSARLSLPDAILSSDPGSSVDDGGLLGSWDDGVLASALTFTIEHPAVEGEMADFGSFEECEPLADEAAMLDRVQDALAKIEAVPAQVGI